MAPTTTRPKPAPRSRRAKLDRTVVVDAALALADRDGLDAVTIRRLAEELGVTPMALYWHFEDKDALLAGIGDRMWDEVVAALGGPDAVAALGGPAPTGGRGRTRATRERGWEALDEVLRALVGVLRRHPAVAALVPERVVLCDAGLAVTEATLGLLHGHGFEPETAAEMARYLLTSAVVLVSSRPGVEVADPAERAEAARRKAVGLAMLPPDRYPNLVAAAPWMVACTESDQYFERGIRTIAAGVRAQRA